MHLTNYAINKNNAAYQQNDASESSEEEVGHKRSLAALLGILENEGANIEKLQLQIDDIIVKTLVIGQPFLSHLYQSC